MDEVDGMSAGDRGGVADLIQVNSLSQGLTPPTTAAIIATSLAS